MLARMGAKTDATRKEMKEELMQGWKPRPIMRSVKSFKVLSSPAWMSPKPGQRPFKKI
jgi:hypothetical protein